MEDSKLLCAASFRVAEAETSRKGEKMRVLVKGTLIGLSDGVRYEMTSTKDHIDKPTQIMVTRHIRAQSHEHQQVEV